MKRFLQLLGEMKSYRLPTAKRALEELALDDELVIVVPEQALAGEIQQWATSQGLTVAPPKKMLDGLARWQLSVKNAVPAPAVEAKPAAATPAATPAPAAAGPSPATKPAAPAASAPAAAPPPTPAPAATAAPAPTASSTAPAAPAASDAPAAAPAPADAPARSTDATAH